MSSRQKDSLTDEKKQFKTEPNNEISTFDETDESYNPDESNESSSSDENSNSNDSSDLDEDSNSSKSESSSSESDSDAMKDPKNTSSKIIIQSNDTTNTKQTFRSSDSIVLKKDSNKPIPKKSVIRVNSVTGTKIEVALRNIKEKLSRKDPWKKNGDMRNSQNSTLLGNLNIGKWDDDDDDNDEMNQQIKKTADMRKVLTNKIAQEERKRKRNMYLNSWDAALDAGKKEKIKEKKTEGLYDNNIDSKLNPFHRIQSSMQAMGRGRAKGHNNASSLSSSFRRKSLGQKRMKNTKMQNTKRKY